MGIMVKGKKYYGDKYPQFINRVQSIRNSKDEILFFFFFPSQYSMLKLTPALSSLLVPVFDASCSPRHPTFLIFFFHKSLHLQHCCSLQHLCHTGWVLMVSTDVDAFCLEWKGHRLQKELTPLYQPYSLPSLSDFGV